MTVLLSSLFNIIQVYKYKIVELSKFGFRINKNSLLNNKQLAPCLLIINKLYNKHEILLVYILVYVLWSKPSYCSRNSNVPKFPSEGKEF